MANRVPFNDYYVETLYDALMNRVGKADWVSQLNAGADRHAIMAGFYNSAEFDKIMADYGIY